jgi:hypothetical protein
MTIPAGALRFNSDSGKLEVYCGGPVGFGTTTITGAWFQIDSFSPDSATGGARGVFGGGTNPTNVIDYVNISSTGDAIDFGDLINPTQTPSACSSSTRGVFGGGDVFPLSGPVINVIQYITISSTGDAIDFGDLSVAKTNVSACSSSTRGVFGGGRTPTPVATVFNTIEYITISSTGDAIDFGDLSVGKSSLGACSSSTRGIFGGGISPTPATIRFNTIEYITISSTGDAVDFGDLSVGKNFICACSNSTRGIFGGGFTPSYLNTIEYITISSTGDAIDFGDLSVGKSSLGACSSSTRGVFGGGFFTPPTTRSDVIEYVNIMSTGNAVDFGDLTIGRNNPGACSNGHGGL